MSRFKAGDEVRLAPLATMNAGPLGPVMTVDAVNGTEVCCSCPDTETSRAHLAAAAPLVSADFGPRGDNRLRFVVSEHWLISASPDRQPETFDPPFDLGIASYVTALRAAGVETYESCQGGEGHAFPAPTVRFHGNNAAGLRALSAALDANLPVSGLRRVWDVINREATGPTWEMVFSHASIELRLERLVLGTRAASSPAAHGTSSSSDWTLTDWLTRDIEKAVFERQKSTVREHGRPDFETSEARGAMVHDIAVALEAGLKAHGAVLKPASSEPVPVGEVFDRKGVGLYLADVVLLAEGGIAQGFGPHAAAGHRVLPAVRAWEARRSPAEASPESEPGPAAPFTWTPLDGSVPNPRLAVSLRDALREIPAGAEVVESRVANCHGIVRNLGVSEGETVLVLRLKDGSERALFVRKSGVIHVHDLGGQRLTSAMSAEHHASALNALVEKIEDILLESADKTVRDVIALARREDTTHLQGLRHRAVYDHLDNLRLVSQRPYHEAKEPPAKADRDTSVAVVLADPFGDRRSFIASLFHLGTHFFEPGHRKPTMGDSFDVVLFEHGADPVLAGEVFRRLRKGGFSCEVFFDANMGVGVAKRSATTALLQADRAIASLTPTGKMVPRDKPITFSVQRVDEDLVVPKLESGEVHDPYTSVRVERAYQDGKWGGPKHDDAHTTRELTDIIRNYCKKADAETRVLARPGEKRAGLRHRFVQIAALAIAAIESVDRTNACKVVHMPDLAAERAHLLDEIDRSLTDLDGGEESFVPKPQNIPGRIAALTKKVREALGEDHPGVAWTLVDRLMAFRKAEAVAGPFGAIPVSMPDALRLHLWQAWALFRQKGHVRKPFFALWGEVSDLGLKVRSYALAVEERSLPKDVSMRAPDGERGTTRTLRKPGEQKEEQPISPEMVERLRPVLKGAGFDVVPAIRWEDIRAWLIGTDCEVGDVRADGTVVIRRGEEFTVVVRPADVDLTIGQLAAVLDCTVREVRAALDLFVKSSHRRAEQKAAADLVAAAYEESAHIAETCSGGDHQTPARVVIAGRIRERSKRTTAALPSKPLAPKAPEAPVVAVVLAEPLLGSRSYIAHFFPEGTRLVAPGETWMTDAIDVLVVERGAADADVGNLKALLRPGGPVLPVDFARGTMTITTDQPKDSASAKNDDPPFKSHVPTRYTTWTAKTDMVVHWHRVHAGDTVVVAERGDEVFVRIPRAGGGWLAPGKIPERVAAALQEDLDRLGSAFVRMIKPDEGGEWIARRVDPAHVRRDGGKWVLASHMPIAGHAPLAGAPIYYVFRNNLTSTTAEAVTIATE